MEYRHLGSTDLQPSVIGFGCSRIASLNNSHTQDDVRSLIHRTIDRGINFFDTADSYGGGDSERFLGKAVRGLRNELLICSKAGYDFGAFPKIMRWVKPLAKRIVGTFPATQNPSLYVRNQVSRQNFSPSYIRTAIEGSLRRLGTDYLDLFLLHSPPATVLQNEEIFKTLENLKTRGMIRYFGVSCATGEEALACLTIPQISVLQLAVHVQERYTLQKILPLAIEKGMPIIARQPFAGGSVFSHPPLLNFAKRNPARTMAQVALQFVAQLQGVGVVLPGISSLPHLEDNCNILSLPSLSSNEMDTLSS